jgi:AI-2 transport protein TqsA
MAEVERRFLGVRFLVATASLIVVVAGLRAAQSVLVPFVFAVFLAILGAAPLSWLRRRKVPSVLAVFLVALIIAGLFTLVAFMLGTSINEFTAALPRYQGRFKELQMVLNGYLERFQIQVSASNIFASTDPHSVMDLFTKTIRGIGTALSATLYTPRD